MNNNDRFAWAVKMLNVRPSDTILEFGCGTGIAAEMVASLLKDGHLTAIDRSKPMISKAMQRNADHIQKKKASFHTIELAKLPAGDQSHSKIFAFNVNLFWTKNQVSQEAKVLRSHLSGLYLFYQPPSASMLKKIAESVSCNLEAEHWKMENTLYEKNMRASCFIMRPLKIK